MTDIEWEREKFAKELELKAKEIHLGERRLKAENRRSILIGALVPVALGVMTALPVYINSQNQKALQQAKFEAELIVDSVKTGDPDQAAENLRFLVNTGLLSKKTATDIDAYLIERVPGTGRALPPSQ